MAKGVLNFKMNEANICAVKEAASVYNTTMIEIIAEAIHEYLEKKQMNHFYRLSVNAGEASAEESTEIPGEIKGLSDDDLTISSVKEFRL